MNRRCAPSVALPLTGLLTEVDAAAARRMAAHDALPVVIRRRLTTMSFDFPALKIRDHQLMNGTAATLSQINRSVVAEANRFVRDRAAALDWARETFMIRGRR